MDIWRRFYDIVGECGMPRPPFHVWRRALQENAELWPIAGGDEMIGGVLFIGHTMHIAVLPEWHGRWLKPSHLKAWRQFQHEVDLYATPDDDNEAACRLAEALGFREAPERRFDAFGELCDVTGAAAGRKIYVKERNAVPQLLEEALCHL